MSRYVSKKLRGQILVKHGFPFKSEFFKEVGGYVVLTPGNFHEEGGFKRNAEKDKCYSHSFPEEYLLEQGDIIVAMTEQSEGLLGSMAKVPENNKFLHNQRLGLVTTQDSGVLLDFIYHLFKTNYVRRQIQLTSTGSKVKHTAPKRIYDLSVLLPSFDEQTRISNLLSSLDAKIELNNRINAELEAMAKTLYDYWFVQFDFPDANHRPYKSSGGKMVYNKTLKREIPVGWSDGTLEDLGTIVGGSTPAKSNPDNFSDNGISWITPKDLSRNKGNKYITKGECDVSEQGLKNASLRKLPTGSILLSTRAPIGYMAIARNPMTTNQGFKSFIANKNYSTTLVYYTIELSMTAIEQNACGSTFSEISTSVLRTIKVSLPGQLQHDRFSEIVDPIFKQQDRCEKETQHLTELRDWLLPMLMNGQVKVG